MIARLLLAGGFGVICLYAFIRSFDFPDIAGYFPRFAAGAGMVLGAIEFVRIGIDAVRSRSATGQGVDSKVSGQENRRSSIVAGAYYLGWAAGFMLLTYLFGAMVAAAVWLPLYGAVAGKVRWVILLPGIVAIEFFMVGMRYVGFIEIPPGVLF